MKNLGNMLKQAQSMQTRMAEIQDELQAVEISGQSGAGLVSATVSGKGDLRGLKLDPAIVDKDEIGVLEDLIVPPLTMPEARPKK